MRHIEAWHTGSVLDITMDATTNVIIALSAEDGASIAKFVKFFRADDYTSGYENIISVYCDIIHERGFPQLRNGVRLHSRDLHFPYVSGFGRIA